MTMRGVWPGASKVADSGLWPAGSGDFDAEEFKELTLPSLKGGDSYGSRRETSCFIADCPPGELR
ncbi:hypothetical protein ACFUJR_36665, partial [Streptomyces sp. NPDC057271]|uniref:hypothetical protein n=1 Tax=unclassified Streptomyces TaxID=2593676 RepID=UPI00363EABDB